MEIPDAFLETVTAELAKLPDFASQIFLARLADDRTFDDIADQMDCSVEDAEDIYQLACEALREVLSLEVEIAST